MIVIVLGGGFMGRAATFILARRGVRVPSGDPQLSAWLANP